MRFTKKQVYRCIAAILAAGMLLGGCTPADDSGSSTTTTADNAGGTTATGSATTGTTGTTATTIPKETVPTWTLPTEVTVNEKLTTKTLTMKDVAKKAHLRGRNLEIGTGISFEWSSSGFDLYGVFEGDIILGAYTDIGPGATHFEVVVDGDYTNTTTVTCNVGEGEYYLVRGLKKGYHTIEIYKRTESQFNACIIQELTFTGSLEAWPKTVSRRIEFLGDSITCGQGYEVLGQITDYPGQENGFANYTGQTARALSAEYNVIGLSGWGAFGGGGTDQNRLARVYDWISYRRGDIVGKWDFKQWQPDVVVINLGTNDFNYRNEGNAMSKEDYKREVKNLVNMVRKNNPDTTIVWAYGMMGIHMKDELLEAFDELKTAGETVHYVELPADWSGGDAHPSKTGHKQAAEILSKAIGDIMGWA